MPSEKHGVKWLLDNVTNKNIANDLPREVVAALGPLVVAGFDIDVASRQAWEELTMTGLGIAMQEKTVKTFPWPDCSNVKYPLIATASIQFAARAYPEIVKGSDVVKATVVGEDADGSKEQRAKRVSQHMSFQLTEEMPEWDEDTDKLLHSLPVMGVCYRKSYRCPILKRNVSESRSALQVVVNNGARNLETARRVTDQIFLYKNEVIERERAGIFVDGIRDQFRGDDEEKPQELFLQQHGYADLDGDGYEEPYVITVHKDSGLVANIIARYDVSGIEMDESRTKVYRIEPVQYFTKYSFIPAPNGQYHDLGFAQLLSPLNEAINTVINQMLDAGTLHNLGGGFVGRGVKWMGGVLKFLPGEWKMMDTTGGMLKDNVVPLPTKEPSATLFRLLGALTEAANRLASVSETMTGEAPGQNVPATTVLATIEQGLKVFTAIYKRVFRSLRSEYKKLYRLNRLYLKEEEYFRVLDTPKAVMRADYDGDDLNVIPVADPNISSEAQRLARSTALWETLPVNPSMAGKMEILRRRYEALGTPDIDKVLPPDEIQKLIKAPPPPNPEVLQIELETLKAKHAYELEEARIELERLKMEADIELKKAQAIKAVADAEAVEAGQQFEEYKHEVEQLSNTVKLAIAAMEANTRAKSLDAGDSGTDKPGGDGGVAPKPDDAEGDAGPTAPPGGIQGADGRGTDLESDLSRANGPMDVQDAGTDLRTRFNAGDESL